MTRFCIQITAFLAIVGGIFVTILAQADGYSDPFYIRFTTPKQSSLILGTSKAAQGIQPAVLKPILKKDIFNYAFTAGHSPYGPTYLQSVKRKLSSESEDGIFILMVDPWSLSSTCDDPNDAGSFRENNLMLANTRWVNMNPNIEYLIHNMAGKYHSELMPKRKNRFLHRDGWLEISVTVHPKSVAKRVERTKTLYLEKNIPTHRFSTLRLAYLKKTIKLLQNHGKVYLVRLPVHPEMMKMDNTLMPHFNHAIQAATSLSDGYLDLAAKNGDFTYTDGNHLYKTSGAKVTEMIGHWIKSQVD